MCNVYLIIMLLTILWQIIISGYKYMKRELRISRIAAEKFESIVEYTFIANINYFLQHIFLIYVIIDGRIKRELGWW